MKMYCRYSRIEIKNILEEARLEKETREKQPKLFDKLVEKYKIQKGTLYSWIRREKLEQKGAAQARGLIAKLVKK